MKEIGVVWMLLAWCVNAEPCLPHRPSSDSTVALAEDEIGCLRMKSVHEHFGMRAECVKKAPYPSSTTEWVNDRPWSKR
jgi:hypothetical protein